MTTFSDFEALWLKATTQEKRAIKSFVAAHKFPVADNSLGHPLPDDFRVTPAMRDWAKQMVPGVNISVQTQTFRDWAAANAHRAIGRKLNWVAAWRNFMRNKANR